MTIFVKANRSKGACQMLRKSLVISFCCTLLVGCLDTGTSRDVTDVSSKNIATIFPPKVTKSSPENLEITYAIISMGFDSGCNPFQTFSSELNECAQLPNNVKVLAIDHCAKFNKKAIFSGNKTNLLQMIVSKFKCEAQ